MAFNPFEQKPMKIDDCFSDWKTLASKPYNKNTVDPYTRCRIILMNGTEYESVWMGHQFSRHCDNNDIRREIALIRRVEQQQQKRIVALKPVNETILETTIGYEQLAVDLTAEMARKEKNPYVKAALDFALLEDFDHLYRYADLLENERGIKAEKLVGRYTEIMPGRPTISEHRYPYDDIRRHGDRKKDDPLTCLHVAIITAAEQQTMNYYMNVGAFHDTEEGRKLYAEIGMIEEQHVTHYGSLKDTNNSWLECLLMHEYTECYLYYSCYKDEKDPYIKAMWEEFLEQEIAHLHSAAMMLEKYEKKTWQQLYPNPAFPSLLKIGPNKDYVRNIIATTVGYTTENEDYIEVNNLEPDYRFFCYQKAVNPVVRETPSHRVIDSYIRKHGKDYRYQEKPHPIAELSDRTKDNTCVGREKMKLTVEKPTNAEKRAKAVKAAKAGKETVSAAQNAKAIRQAADNKSAAAKKTAKAVGLEPDKKMAKRSATTKTK